MVTSAAAKTTSRRADALRDALECLDTLAPRKGCIARLHLAGRLSLDQIALYLGLPQTTVRREWRFTRAWLVREMGR